ncbi:hypothetical protein STEG23_023173, partial [Scotinomys teguina]
IHVSSRIRSTYFNQKFMKYEIQDTCIFLGKRYRRGIIGELGLGREHRGCGVSPYLRPSGVFTQGLWWK